VGLKWRGSKQISGVGRCIRPGGRSDIAFKEEVLVTKDVDRTRSVYGPGRTILDLHRHPGVQGAGSGLVSTASEAPAGVVYGGAGSKLA